MIARTWHGYTTPEHADAYEAMLKPEPLPGLGKVKGYRGSYLLRRNAGEEVEFITILLWDSIDAIKAVAGPNYETAVVPEERKKHLSHYDAQAAHYEIVATHHFRQLCACRSALGNRLERGVEGRVRDDGRVRTTNIGVAFRAKRGNRKGHRNTVISV